MLSYSTSTLGGLFAAALAVVGFVSPLASVGSVANTESALDGPALLVGVASPEHFGKRHLSLGKGFPVVITNLSKPSLRIWRDWCSWGYYNLSFEATIGDQVWTLKKKDRAWRKNYPDYWTLAPGESLVVEVRFDPSLWKNAEKLAEAVGQTVRLRAVYTVPPVSTEEHGVWTGRVESPVREYELLK